MLEYVIYGKIIIDDIHLRDGRRVRAVLGGGGPQAVFGARLWSDSVGLLTRSGTDLEPEHVEALRGLDVDLGGWRQFSDIPTPRHFLEYDANEYLGGGPLTSSEDWTRLLGQPLSLPPSYTRPRAIHVITEFPDEPMVQTALALRATGTLGSLEPLLASASEPDWEGMVALMAHVTIVTPDWPSASRIAQSDDPLQILRYWSTLGPDVVAVRHGAHGSYVWSRSSGEAWHIPAVPTEVIDPTGAGNAYGGGLVVGWTETADARLAAAWGALSASLLVRQVGLPHMSVALRHQARTRLPEAMALTRRL